MIINYKLQSYALPNIEEISKIIKYNKRARFSYSFFCYTHQSKKVISADASFSTLLDALRQDYTILQKMKINHSNHGIREII